VKRDERLTFHVARFLQGLLPGPTLNKAISEVLIAIVLGLYIRNALGVSPRFEPGVKFSLQRMLRWGIILLGHRGHRARHRSKRGRVGFRCATITLFGLIAVIFYPIRGVTWNFASRTVSNI
jgi:uncharacterized membrane protein YadS